MNLGRVNLIITIDGPAGAGKSTAAKALASRLHFLYMDTGAMYRAVTLKALRKGVDWQDRVALIALTRTTTVILRQARSGDLEVLLDGEDVSAAIRQVDVTEKTQYIAQEPVVRKVVVSWQRKIGEQGNVVVEGRDVGTVVFPKARYKFYLDADAEQRITRRLKDFAEQDEKVDAATVRKTVLDRDQSDMTRKASPLKKADDAIVIDTTDLTVEQTVAKMLGYIDIGGLSL